METQRRMRGSQAVKSVPVVREILADVATPIQVLRRMKATGKQVFLLESAGNDEVRGRYSFLGVDPRTVLRCKDGVIETDGEEKYRGDPRVAIRHLLDAWKAPERSDLPPFCGGLVGYFSYDYLRYAEPEVVLTGEDAGFCDCELMLFNKVVTFDNIRQRIILIVTLPGEELAEGTAESILDELEEMVTSAVISGEEGFELQGDFTESLGEVAYKEAVKTVKEHIIEGDLFQAVVSNRMTAPAAGSLLGPYRRLRADNPSPYMYYLDTGSVEIAGASPETLVRLVDGEVFTFPIAGTRPRGANPEEDRRLAQELLADEKELAEHNMLVDLGRNDLGRISRYGSVRVTDYLKVRRYAHVMHLTSEVKGQINPSCDALDCVDSLLPAGTLSGAPKLRAIEIVDGLEEERRGIYGGAVGYLDFRGNADLCITIRTAVKKDDRVYVQAGAGIVYDSDPQKEYAECRQKMRGLILALDQEVSDDSTNR